MAARPPLTAAGLWFLRIVPAAIFLYAGVAKIFNPAQLADDILGYEILPYAPAVAAALYLPWLEIAAACALFHRRLRLGALVVLSGLSLAFLLALISVQARGIELIACGCFGGNKPPPQPPNVPLHIAGDSVLFFLLVILLAIETCSVARNNVAAQQPH